MERQGGIEGTPVQTVSMDHPGIMELVYTWRHSSGHRVEGTKTVYDPEIISDQQFAENVRAALEIAIANGLQNGDNEVRVGKITYNVQVRKNIVRTVFPMLPSHAIEEMR